MYNKAAARRSYIYSMEKKKINESAFRRAAELLRVEVAAIKAVAQVESGAGGGFLPSGRARILFEGHIMWRQLKKMGLDPKRYVAGNEDIIHPTWNRNNYLGGEAEYERLARAQKIDAASALNSTSWGVFQIMGFNHKACSTSGIKQFVELINTSEEEQLMLFCSFIEYNNLVGYLRIRDWKGFAKRYNGAGYMQNRYDVRLSDAYRKFAHQ